MFTIKLIINEKKEGIVSILGSDDCERIRGGVGASSAAAASLSLRRTLSADMSSKKWLAQNGFRPIMKKIASSEELPISSASSFSSSSSSEGEEDQEEELQRPGQDEVWMSIQTQKQKEEQVKASSNGWTWGSILTQKNDDNEGESKQTPYIHPLVKRSSSLSEKSLEICTESLGSETGSDGFSSYPPSEAGDVDEEKQQQSQQQQQSYNDNNNNNSSFMEEDLGIISVNYNYNNRKLMQSRSFPPPLPSLAAREDGASLHMNCHRHNGRLVLEAVSVPSQNYFHAQRQDGRLLLTLINNPSSPNCDEMEEEDEVEEYARVFDNIEEEIEDEIMQDEDGDDDEFEIEAEEEEQMEEKIDSKRSSEMEYYVPEQISRFERGGGGGGVGVGLMNVHKSALVMKKVIAINNNNLTWSPNLNKSVNRMIEFEEEEGGEDRDDEQLTAQIPQSLPPPPRLISTAAPPAAAASFNAYEYFWRQQKPSVANIIKQIPPPPPQQQSLKNKELINHQNEASAAAARNSKGNHYHHRHHEHNNAEYNLVRRCNETRKSLLRWGEPHCIASSLHCLIQN